MVETMKALYKKYILSAKELSSDEYSIIVTK